jgi:translocation and assembly module TamA
VFDTSSSSPLFTRRGYSWAARLALPLLLLTGNVFAAQPHSFVVELEAPAALKPALEKQLQIYNEIADPALTELRFGFLVRRAVEEIKSILMTEGYFSPTIKQRVEREADRLLAHFEVLPGEPSRITGIDLRFRGAIADPGVENDRRSTDLRRLLSLRVNEIFRNAEWDKAKQQLLQALRSDQYPAARIIDSEALVEPDAHTVTLRIEVDSGPPFTFGELAIEGLSVLPASIVTSLNRIKPGSRYSERDLSDFQNRLQQTNYFRSVFVTAPKDPASPERVPIRVRVVENTGRRIGIGASLSTDVGIGAEFRYDDNLTFRPGWRSRSTIKADQREQSAATELYLMPILGELQPRTDLQVKQTDIQNDYTLSSILGARLLRPGFESEYTLSIELRNERHESAGQFVSESASMPLNISWTRRRLDNALYPHNGFIVNLQAGGALDQTISDKRFTRLYGKASTYWPLGARATLILRGELGAVNATSSMDIPDDYLFRAGGSQTVRGYAYGALGIEQNGAIVPGLYIGVASAEVSYPVAEQWAVALFYDAGNVVDRWQDFSAVRGYGIGARWRSPLGPLNVDLAYGEETKAYRVHFAVGVTF